MDPRPPVSVLKGGKIKIISHIGKTILKTKDRNTFDWFSFRYCLVEFT